MRAVTGSTVSDFSDAVTVHDAVETRSVSGKAQSRQAKPPLKSLVFVAL